MWTDAPGVDQIVVCSPDKDLAQLVTGDKVVCLDRRRGTVIDEPGVLAKFGVQPKSIPDFLALVGDSADGIPGIPRWGAKSSAAVLRRYCQIDRIPLDSAAWDVDVRGAGTMAVNLSERWDDALLFKDLATLRFDAPIHEDLADLEWRGVPRERYLGMCDDLGFGRLVELPHKWDDRA